MERAIFLLACLSLLFVLPGSAQNRNLDMGLWAMNPAGLFQTTGFVIAGDSSGLVAGNKTVLLNQGPVPFGNFDVKEDSIDLNNDNIFDVLFNVNVCNTFDCVAGSAGLQGLHPGFNFINGPDYIRRFSAGDTIAADANWDNFGIPAHYSSFISIGSGLGGLQNTGEWLSIHNGYFGFRLVTPASDTLLGWVHVNANSLSQNGASLKINSWAIQHDPSQKPVVKINSSPQKNVYCAGDTVLFKANLLGETQFAWHFWDGSTDSSAAVLKVLPDSTVAVTLTASNPNGATVKTQVLQVSPLVLTAPDITLDCAHPTGALTAETNIPATIWWIIGQDTIAGPIPPPLNPSSFPLGVIVQDAYGCTASDQIEILLDTDPPAVTIEYDEINHLLIAHASTPGVVFKWVAATLPEPVYNDSVLVTQSAFYTVTATAENGCTSVGSITIMVTDVDKILSLAAVLIQPNPAGDFLQIENRSATDLNMNVLDFAGKRRMTCGVTTANSVSSTNISALSGGSYLLAGYDADGNLLIYKKFVKL